MRRLSFLAHAPLIAAGYLSAQPAATIADHVLWERDFPDLHMSAPVGAVADRAGNLWAVDRPRAGSGSLICITANGEIRLKTELPRTIVIEFPTRISSFKLAVSASGSVALLAYYSHAKDRAVYFDGATIASVNPDGKLSLMKKVAESGPEYKGFTALSDGQFLLLGDQSPMVVMNVSGAGNVAWRRTFPSNWVLPSAAALGNGSSCVVSPDYKRAVLHMVWMDKAGAVLHKEEIPGNRSDAAGYGDSCTILYSRTSAKYQSEYFLTSFDRNFNRTWTVPVLASAPSGGMYRLALVQDGYLVAIDAIDALFLAKYTSAGRLVWSVTDASRRSADDVVPAGDYFYLIGAGLKDRYSLHVIRAR